MKSYLILGLILILTACIPIEQPQTNEPEEPAVTCEEGWVCTGTYSRAYRNADCNYEKVEDCPGGCINSVCKKEEPVEEEPIVEEQEEVEPEEQTEEETVIEPQESKDDVQKVFNYAKTKIKSYTYKYKEPSGKQYYIYVKGNLMRINPLSENNEIFLDTEKKTAEEWCIVYSKCGRHTGKIADFDYYNAYILTPIDWLDEINESEKLDEGFYFGRKAYNLQTNIGEVIIDSNYGFIMSIKQEDKTYSFTETAFNAVKDSDVTVPEYLLE
jgi:hypothetical protein